MNSSPVTGTWEGVEAYFSFADQPGIMAVILAASVAVTIGAIVISARHETESARKHVAD